MNANWRYSTDVRHEYECHRFLKSASRLPQIAQILVSTFKIFKRGGGGGGGSADTMSHHPAHLHGCCLHHPCHRSWCSIQALCPIIQPTYTDVSIIHGVLFKQCPIIQPTYTDVSIIHGVLFKQCPIIRPTYTDVVFIIHVIVTAPVLASAQSVALLWITLFF